MLHRDLNNAAAREVARLRLRTAETLNVCYPEMEADRYLLSHDSGDQRVADEKLLRPVQLSTRKRKLTSMPLRRPNARREH